MRIVSEMYSHLNPSTAYVDFQPSSDQIITYQDDREKPAVSS